MAALDDATKYNDALEKDGFCVVPNIISAERAAQYAQKAYDWLESFKLGFDRNDPSTWKQDNLPKSFKNDIYLDYGIAHEQFVWDIRQDPEIVSLYKKLFSVDKVIFNFNGVNISLPPVAANAGEVKESDNWPHVDARIPGDGPLFLQGAINLIANGPEDGGLMILKGSHEYLKQLNHSREDLGDWNPLLQGVTPESVEYLVKEKGLEWEKVCAGPGDMVIWLPHAVHYGIRSRSDKARIATYVCVQPWDRPTPVRRKEQVEAFEKSLSLNNCQGVDILTRVTKADPSDPASLVRLAPEVPPVLTPLGREIAGFDCLKHASFV